MLAGHDLDGVRASDSAEPAAAAAAAAPPPPAGEAAADLYRIPSSAAARALPNPDARSPIDRLVAPEPRSPP